MLSNWMKTNLMLSYITVTNPQDYEQDLINHFNPPLNIRDNRNPINAEFRRNLSEMRGKNGAEVVLLGKAIKRVVLISCASQKKTIVLRREIYT